MHFLRRDANYVQGQFWKLCRGGGGGLKVKIRLCDIVVTWRGCMRVDSDATTLRKGSPLQVMCSPSLLILVVFL